MLVLWKLSKRGTLVTSQKKIEGCMSFINWLDFSGLPVCFWDICLICHIPWTDRKIVFIIIAVSAGNAIDTPQSRCPGFSLLFTFFSHFSLLFLILQKPWILFHCPGRQSLLCHCFSKLLTQPQLLKVSCKALFQTQVNCSAALNTLSSDGSTCLKVVMASGG